MPVSVAITLVPCEAPMPTIVCASALASASCFIKAPDPVLMSRTRPSMPSASFFDMIEDAISGRDGTVPVLSRRA